MKTTKRRHKLATDPIFFEQYRMVVESAEQVSIKRGEANRFYVTINTLLLGASGYLATVGKTAPVFLISIASIVASLNWERIITAYKNLNSAKFKIIHEMEEHLPVNVFQKEDKLLVKSKYFGLTRLERVIPWLFVVLHLVVLIAALFRLGCFF